MINYLKDKATHFIVTLRFSLLFIFALLFLITATIFTSIFYLHVSEIVERAALLLMDEASELTLEEFNNDFKPFMLSNQFSDELIKDRILNVKSHHETAIYLVDILKEYPMAESAHWYDSEGNLVYAWRTANNTMATKIINKKSGEEIDEFFSHDHATTFAKHLNTSPTLNWHGTVGYKAALQQHRSIWTNVFIYKHTPYYMGTAIATPIFDKNGKPKGVLEIDLRLNEFSKKLAQHKISPHGKVLVINQDGNIIAAPELTKPQTTDSNVRLQNIESYPEYWVGEAYKIYQRDKLTTFSFTYKGTRYLATFKSIPIFSDDKWLISIVVPASDFSKRVHEVERAYISVFILIFILGLVLISNLVSRVINPVKKLVLETKQIRLFELDNTSYIRSHIKEVIDLAEAIYTMKTGLRSFQKYVPAGLVRQLIYAGEDAHIGGMKRKLAIFFSDIKDFTSLTETTDTDQLIKQVYEYFEALAPVVTRNNGTIDKYIGDAMMAFWGAPVVVDKPCDLAARAALQCQIIIRALNNRWRSEDKPQFITRIGIHYGNTIVGNIGSSDRLNYTVVGSVVNMTNRLVNANKVYGTSILVSESIYEQIKTTFILRFVDKIILKGSHTSMAVYELLAMQDTHLPFDVATYSIYFNQAYSAYQNQDWTKAIALFNQCLTVYPQDTLADVFIERCKIFKLHPPHNWNGSWQMTEK